MLLGESFAYDAEIWPQLPALWKRLLLSNRLIGAVVEEPLRPPGQQILGFGTSIFMNEQFAAEAVETPYLRNLVARRLLHGDPIALDPAGIRAANSNDGLRLLLWDVAPYPERQIGPGPAIPNPADEERNLAAYKMIEAAFHMFGGYQLREIVIDTYGKDKVDGYLAGGYHLRSDYSDYFRERQAPPPSEHPYRFGLTREEARMEPFSYAASLFAYSPPRIGFTAAEQEQLLHALEGLNDDELAQELSVSPNTVKARWRGIYTRVAAKHESLLSDERPNAALRGQEKRRSLLHYLRSHLSELRPH